MSALIETDPQGTFSNLKRRRPLPRRSSSRSTAARGCQQRLANRFAHDGRYGGRILDYRRGRSAATIRTFVIPDPACSDATEHRRHRGDPAATLRVHSGLGNAVFAYVLHNQTLIGPRHPRRCGNALSKRGRARPRIVAPLIVMLNDPSRRAGRCGPPICEHAPVRQVRGEKARPPGSGNRSRGWALRWRLLTTDHEGVRGNTRNYSLNWACAPRLSSRLARFPENPLASDITPSAATLNRDATRKQSGHLRRLGFFAVATDSPPKQFPASRGQLSASLSDHCDGAALKLPTSSAPVFL